jgi:hypothetical protein
VWRVVLCLIGVDEQRMLLGLKTDGPPLGPVGGMFNNKELATEPLDPAGIPCLRNSLTL